MTHVSPKDECAQLRQLTRCPLGSALSFACCCEEGTEEKEAAPFPMRDVIARPASTAPSSHPMGVRAKPKSSQSWRRASQQVLLSPAGHPRAPQTRPERPLTAMKLAQRWTSMMLGSRLGHTRPPDAALGPPPRLCEPRPLPGVRVDGLLSRYLGFFFIVI